MTADFGISSRAGALAASQVSRAQARDDIKENTTRDARSAFRHTTTGAGSVVTSTVKFDCRYIEEPHFSHGAVLTKAPDLALYHLPLGQAGVYEWITEKQQPDAPDLDLNGDPPKLFWTGAKLYFEVQVRLREDQDESVLTSSPAKCVMEHHLSFNGVAMKKLSTAIEDTQGDLMVTPRSTFGVTVASTTVTDGSGTVIPPPPTGGGDGGGTIPPVGGGTDTETAKFKVSKTGNNSDGLTWATAWNELDQIDWAAVAPGDTIAIDGGATTSGSSFINWSSYSSTRPDLVGGVAYTTSLTPTISGTIGNPITIRKSIETGRNGQVLIFGGRTTLLPEAQSAGYVAGGGTPRTIGVELANRAYLTLDGGSRSGIMIYGFGGDAGPIADNTVQCGGTGWGVRCNASSDHITLRNLEIFDCGTYALMSSTSTYKSDQPGIALGGTSITIDRCLVHDCGQDPIQAKYALSDPILSNTWLYGSRFHSVWAGYGFNAGSQAISAQNTTHTDGIQAFGGGTHQGPVLVDHCVVGPLLSQGLYFGDGSSTTFDNVTITDTLILAPFRHGIQGDASSSSTPANWTIRRCTIHGPSTPFTGYSSTWIGIEVESGSGHSIQDTIVSWGASLANSAGFTGTNSGNIYAGIGGDPLPGGSNVDPVFVNGIVPTTVTMAWAGYQALNLTPTATAALGKGAPLHTLNDLLTRIDSLNG